MKWFKHDQPPTEGTRARIEAEKSLERTRAETPDYRELAARLRELRERNHFGAAVAATFRGEESR